jgi:hypothetical protein
MHQTEGNARFPANTARPQSERGIQAEAAHGRLPQLKPDRRPESHTRVVVNVVGEIHFIANVARNPMGPTLCSYSGRGSHPRDKRSAQKLDQE